MLFDETLRDLLRKAKTIAIVGAKDKPGSPVDRVGRYLMAAGYEIMPVHPVRNGVWGLPTLKNLGDLPHTPDIVCLFRASEYCPAHAREVLQLPDKPLLFWMQEGVASPEAGDILAGSGIRIVEDRCLMAEHRRLSAPPTGSPVMADRSPARPASLTLRRKAASTSKDATSRPRKSPAQENGAPPEAASEPIFECRRCGHCCRGDGGIVVGHGDLPRLSSFFHTSDQDFLTRFTETRGGKPMLLTGQDGCCVFFQESRGCAAHPARPDVCRAWPYFRGNLVDEISFAMARQDCPGISARASHCDFAREGYDYLRRHKLLAKDKNREGRALIVRVEELPRQAAEPFARETRGTRGTPR